MAGELVAECAVARGGVCGGSWRSARWRRGEGLPGQSSCTTPTPISLTKVGPTPLQDSGGRQVDGPPGQGEHQREQAEERPRRGRFVKTTKGDTPHEVAEITGRLAPP